MKVEEIALAVLIQFCLISVTEVAGGRLRHHRRRQHGHRRRERVGRQEVEDVTEPVTLPSVERYDLTSYGGDYDNEAPPLSYGAPPPEQDISDVYVGDIPDASPVTVEDDPVISGDTELAAASDEPGDEVREEVEGVTAARSDEVPAWCDPTHPLGAWLNYLNIQEWCISRGFTNLSPYAGPGNRARAGEVEGEQDLEGSGLSDEYEYIDTY